MESLQITRNTKPDKLLIARRNLRALGRDLDRLWIKALTYRDSEWHLTPWIIDKFK